MYRHLSAGLTIVAKTAWISSGISRRCTRAATAMCMSWPQAYATVNHLLCSFSLRAELATVPTTVLDEWAATGFPNAWIRISGTKASMLRLANRLKTIPYKELDLNLPWESFDIAHALTTTGIQKFVADYQNTLTPP